MQMDEHVITYHPWIQYPTCNWNVSGFRRNSWVIVHWRKLQFLELISKCNDIRKSSSIGRTLSLQRLWIFKWLQHFDDLSRQVLQSTFFFSGQKLTKKWTNRVYAAKHLAIVWCLFSWNGVRRVWLHITCEFFKKNLPFFGSFYQDPWIYHSPRMLVTTKIITFLSSGIPTENFHLWLESWLRGIYPTYYTWYILGI